MKFKIHKASDWDYEREVEINSLEDLKNLEEIFMIESNCYSDSPLIVDFEEREIKIYDYYIE